MREPPPRIPAWFGHDVPGAHLLESDLERDTPHLPTVISRTRATAFLTGTRSAGAPTATLGTVLSVIDTDDDASRACCRPDFNPRVIYSDNYRFTDL
ncbi:hypothetical protein ACVGVM_29775 (plasmid) [Pseudonocardia bannensis]